MDPYGSLVYRGTPVLSFKQIDRLNGLPKGSAFRAFKRCRSTLQEGVHYFYLSPDAPELTELRQRGVLYHGPAHAVLVTQAGYALLQQAGASPGRS